MRFQLSISRRRVLRIAGVMVGLLLSAAGCAREAGTAENASSQTSNHDQLAGRVLKAGVIKVGYVVYPPGLMKDANTGKVSGVFVDLLEQSAAKLSLKVQWTEEVGWGTMIEGLRTRRYDMIGSPVWSNASRAREADFTIPVFYSGIGAYVRPDDHRFDGDLSKLNAAAVRIAEIDGEMSSLIASAQYPKATIVGSPQTTDNSRILLDVASGRADVTFVEPYIAGLYLANNAGKIRNLVPNKPLRVFPNTMMIPQGEPSFKAMLNAALEEQINTGAVDELLTKYKVPKGSFYPVAAPYREQ